MGTEMSATPAGPNAPDAVARSASRRAWAAPKTRRLATSAAELSSTPDVDGNETFS
jgi:hypothetical protein